MRWAVATIVLFGAVAAVFAANPPRKFVSVGADGKLAYDADTSGNRIPDFSHAGYEGGEVAISDAPVKVVVAPVAGDNTARIQAAIDYVSALKPDANGIRGTVLLLAGRHEVAGQLLIAASGGVLRGQGEAKTTLGAAGLDRRTLIREVGTPSRK